MKYFVIEGKLKNTSPIDNNLMNEHIAYSNTAIDKGLILTSGLKSDVSGGLLIMKAKSINDIETYLSNEPLKLAGLQEYRIIEFQPHYVQAGASNWFEK